MQEREDQITYRLGNMLRRFHAGEYPDGKGAQRIMSEMTALGMSQAEQYEYFRLHSVYLAESNNMYTTHQLRRFDELVLHAEIILEVDGFELPQAGSRVSDFKLVPFGSVTSDPDFNDLVF